MYTILWGYNMTLFVAIVHTIIALIIFNCAKYYEKLTYYEVLFYVLNIIFGIYFWSQVIMGWEKLM